MQVACSCLRLTLKVCLLTAYCWFFSASAWSAQILGSQTLSLERLDVSEVMARDELSQYLWRLDLAHNSLSVDQVLAQLAGLPWQGSERSAINARDIKQDQWLYLPLHNSSDQDFHGVFSAPAPIVGRFHIYLVKDGRIVDTYSSGWKLPFSERRMGRDNGAEIFLAANESISLLIRMNSRNTGAIAVDLLTAHEYYDKQYFLLFWSGLFFGTVLFASLYNLFIYYFVRERVYLIYVLFAWSAMAVEFISKEFAVQYLWPSSPELSLPLVVIFITLSQIFACLFFVAYLNLKKVAPVIMYVSYGILALGLGLAVWQLLDLDNVLPYKLQLYSVALLTIVGIGTSLLFGVRGNVLARYFFVAWSSQLIFSLTGLIFRAGLFPPNFLTVYAVQIGVLAEVLLLSIALAAKIEQLRKEKDDLQERNMEALKKEMIANQSALKASAESQAKSQFLAKMSHEIRTPMNGVLGISDLLRETPLDHTQKEYVDIIQASGSSLVGIINDILDFSKIESGQIELEEVEFDVQRLVSDALNIFYAQAKEKDIELRVEIDNKIPPSLIGDPTRLKQVLINLVGNALKFTQDGSVTVSVGVLPLSEDHTDHDFVCVEFIITDTGVGMNDVTRNKLFESYVQADASINRRYGGTGLGLVISKQLVELMGGKIQVQSQEGKGSIFSYQLQLRRKEDQDNPTTTIPIHGKIHRQETGAQDHEVELVKIPRKSVLVAEDNRVNRKVVEAMLLKLNQNVEFACNGVEALALFSSGAFDLILMDCDMPEMDGYEATERIRVMEQQLDRPKTPIIALSAHVLEEHRQKAFAVGMDDYVFKPITKTVLETLLTGLFVEGSENNEQGKRGG